MEEILRLIAAANEILALAQAAYERAKALGDPTTDEVRAQMARSKAAVDEFHDIVHQPET